jgi:hypothetical protein
MENLKDANALSVYMLGMTKSRYWIYWLKTIMNQIFHFELHQFDPIKEKENYVDLSKLKIALSNYNVPNGSAFANLMARKMAASIAAEGSGHHANLGDGKTIGNK